MQKQLKKDMSTSLIKCEKDINDNVIANLHLAMVDEISSNIVKKTAMKNICDTIVILKSLLDLYHQFIVNITNNNIYGLLH